MDEPRFCFSPQPAASEDGLLLPTAARFHSPSPAVGRAGGRTGQAGGHGKVPLSSARFPGPLGVPPGVGWWLA